MDDIYTPMHEVLTEKTVGTARVEHYTISEADAQFSQMRAVVTARRNEAVDAGKHVRLYVDGTLAMSDTCMERCSNYSFVRKANGNVLIAGLGLGLILLPALQKKEVKLIQVVEKNEDVMSVVVPQLHKYIRDHKLNRRLMVVNADIFKYKPYKDEKWDTIYFDIWPTICTDNLKEITKLKRKFGRRLNRENSKCWMGAWQEDHLRNKKRGGW